MAQWDGTSFSYCLPRPLIQTQVVGPVRYHLATLLTLYHLPILLGGAKELGIVYINIIRGAKEPRNLQNHRGVIAWLQTALRWSSSQTITLPQTSMETHIAPFFRGTVVFIGPLLGFHVSFQECMR